jgi:hypothetical protein
LIDFKQKILGYASDGNKLEVDRQINEFLFYVYILQN